MLYSFHNFISVAEEIMTDRDVTVAISGASGIQYAVALIKYLLQKEVPVNIIITKAARLVASIELGLNFNGSDEICDYFGEQFRQQISVYAENDWRSPLASGSSVRGSLVVVPCSMGMLSAIALGASNNLIERACDVFIKEKKQLILVPRETPFSAIHLENMLRLARLDVCILPAVPGFYRHPKSVDEVINFVVGRILDQLHIGHELVIPWGEGS